MTVPWQEGNLITTTVTLEKYNNDFNKGELGHSFLLGSKSP